MAKSLALLATLAVAGATANAASLRENSYIITYKPEVDAAKFSASLEAAFERENAREGVKVEHKVESQYAIGEFKASAVQVADSYLAKLKANPAIASIQPNRIVKAYGIQENPGSWGLSRISQVDRKLPAPYSFPDSAGSGVTVFVIDTGVKTKHPEFEGRAVHGTSTCKGCIADDDNGHGTHCAGTIGSKTYGVAKKVKIIGVKVLNGEGSGEDAEVIAGVNWVVDYVKKNKITKAVASMSLGGEGDAPALNGAIAAAVKEGITFAIAAGNETQDACNVSPAKEPSVITVGSTDNKDRLSDFSNFGKCVDILAPGTDITSTWNNLKTNTISGTSMATPHVAGVAALVLSERGPLSPAEVTKVILGAATPNKISGVRGSPNLLLNNKVQSGSNPPPSTTTTVNPRPTNPPPTTTTTSTRLPKPTSTGVCTPWGRIIGIC